MHERNPESRQKQLFFDQFCTAWCAEYRQRSGSIHCDKGCSDCCSLVVNTTFPEAALVSDALTEEQSSVLRTRADKLKKIADCSGSLKEWLAEYRKQAGPCPFLDTSGACSIYQQRPLSCRSLLSTKEPSWCSTDFSKLSSEEKQKFMASLDRSVVSFPTHYAATPQEIARDLEETLLRDMETVYGFSIIGSFLWLVWLESEYTLSSRLSDGKQAVQEFLESKGVVNQFLIVLS